MGRGTPHFRDNKLRLRLASMSNSSRRRRNSWQFENISGFKRTFSDQLRLVVQIRRLSRSFVGRFPVLVTSERGDSTADSCWLLDWQSKKPLESPITSY